MLRIYFRLKRTIFPVAMLLVLLTVSAKADTIEDTSVPSALDRRIEEEKKISEERFSIIPHKPSYIMPLTYIHEPNQAPYIASGPELQHEEFKFQFSFKIPVGHGIFGEHSQLYFGYTQLALWQAFNTEQSSPFRETNHEPELFITFNTNFNFLGMNTRLINLSVNHQSNGQSGSLSRSWNRVYLDMQMQRGNFLLSVKPWWRIPENLADDNNPDIEDYMGHFELTAAHREGDHVFSMMLRNNLHADNRGAVQLDWSIPVNGKLNAYVQLFDGYGESLIDYNARIQRIGLGFALTSWL